MVWLLLSTVPVIQSANQQFIQFCIMVIKATMALCYLQITKHVTMSQTVANSLPWLDRKHSHFLRLCLRSCFPYVWLLYATWSCDIVRKGCKNKSRISFCTVFNFFLCSSCCEEEGREEVSRDVTLVRFIFEEQQQLQHKSVSNHTVGTGSTWSRSLLQIYLAGYSLTIFIN